MYKSENLLLKVVDQTRFAGQWTRLLVFLCGMAFLGAGCGGGGSGGINPEQPEPAVPPASKPEPTPPSPSLPPPIVTIEEEMRRQQYAAHQEFQNQPGLSQIKADYAYARGATGAGVTVGIIDTAIDRSHPKLAGRTSPQSRNAVGYNPDFSVCTDRDTQGVCVSGGPPSHGTAVGGTIVANRETTIIGNSVPMHGVAFDATLLSIGIPLGTGSGPYSPIVLTGSDPRASDVVERR